MSTASATPSATASATASATEGATEGATRRLAGRLLLGVVALFTMVSPYVADWNETHIYNPYWPPHAKFHNAQTMIFGAAAGLLALLFVAWPRPSRQRLQVGALFAALYWLTQLPAILFPGTAFTDPQLQGLAPPSIAGYVITQVHLASVLVGLVGLGLWLATKSPDGSLGSPPDSSARRVG